jgi:hypothetical protein
MNRKSRECSICSGEADWIRTRMPNQQQMNSLCHRHYQALRERNPILAGYYDAVASTPPHSTQELKHEPRSIV